MNVLSHVLVTNLARVYGGVTRSSFALMSTSSAVHRAAIFLHGWGGKPHKTWRRFQDLILDEPAWVDTDAYFLGYDSVGDELSLSADHLTGFLRLVCPRVPERLLADTFRDTTYPIRTAEQDYDELMLLGHSAGGVVIRLAVLDDLQRVAHGDAPAAEGLLAAARLRLYAPALSGERIAGLRGRIINAVGFSGLSALVRGGSPSAQELAQSSQLLTALRDDTTYFAGQQPDVHALRAQILWAHHDDVVTGRGYRHDAAWRAGDTSHSSVCKPSTVSSPSMVFAHTGCVPGGQRA